MYDAPSTLKVLSGHDDLRVRQAVADQYSSPQTDVGSLSHAILEARLAYFDPAIERALQ